MMARPSDQCWQSGDNADPVNRTHGRTDPSNAVQSLKELKLDPLWDVQPVYAGKRISDVVKVM